MIKQSKLQNSILNENVSDTQEEQIKFITYESFKDYDGEILALYTTKCGGYSTDDAKGFNLKFDLDTSHDNVIKNYELLAKILNFDEKKITMSHQVHETNILVVRNEDIGKGIIKDIDYESVDGLITNKPNCPIVTFYADCIPLYFYDRENKVIAMAHGGWKGTTKGIAKKMAQKLQEEFKTDLSKLKVVIGPGICKSCYEVSFDVIDAANAIASDCNFQLDEDILKDNHIDLKELNKEILLSVGVKEENVEVSDLCTYCLSDLFYSHRRLGLKRGSQVGLMMIK